MKPVSTSTFIKAIILSSILLAAPCFAASQDNAASAMKSQADSFLAGLPPGMQKSQASAIAAAIAGDHSGLQAIRKSRDIPAATPPEVQDTMISPTMKLYTPAGMQSTVMPLLIYLHGGGWTFGSINSCARFCCSMAATGKVKVLAVDYRLAPEYPYPNGLEDCMDAVSYAHTHAAELNIDPAHITIGGDSSGGNLAIATALSAKCQGLIESMVLFYPVTKAFADGSDSWKRYAEGYALDASLMEQFNKAYIRERTSYIPSVDVGTLPPDSLMQLPRALLISAGRDILYSQGKEFAQKAPKDKITFIEFTDAVHLFITVPGQDEAFAQAVKLASDFITQP